MIGACSRWLSKICLLAIFLTSSCASFYAQQSNLTPRIDHWQKQHQYDKALNVIHFLPADHPQYEELSSKTVALEEQRARYIRQIIQFSDQAAQNQDWVMAIATVNKALTNLPKEPELLSKREHYQQQQAIRVQRDRAAILLAHANYIIRARPFQESLLYHSARNFEVRQQYDRFQLDAKNTSRELYAIAADYWQREQINQAKATLLLSIQTAPNPLSEELLITVLAFETDKRRIARNQQTQAATDQWPELVASFNQLIENQDLSAAQWVLNELTELNAPEANQLRQQLQELKQRRAEQLISHGNKLYNAGLLDEAIESWQQALALTPENTQLEQNIFRAQTFLGNVERWSESLPSSQPTAP